MQTMLAKAVERIFFKCNLLSRRSGDETADTGETSKGGFYSQREEILDQLASRRRGNWALEVIDSQKTSDPPAGML
jgi:hypothetical protein